MSEQFRCNLLLRLIHDPTEDSWSPRTMKKAPNEEASKMEVEQPASNVEQFTPLNLDSFMERLDVLEDILCSRQKPFSESQTIAKINDLVETTKDLKATLTNLEDKYVEVQAKQNNYKIITTSMTRVKKNQQLLGSRLDVLEKKGKQGGSDDSDDADLSLASRVQLLEEALFSVQVFEPNTQLTKEMKELSEKNKALEIKIKFLQKKLSETHANQIALRVDLDKLDNKTLPKRKDLDNKGNKMVRRASAVKEKTGSTSPVKEGDDNQEQ